MLAADLVEGWEKTTFGERSEDGGVSGVHGCAVRPLAARGC
jgi:hypothetical protein